MPLLYFACCESCFRRPNTIASASCSVEKHTATSTSSEFAKFPEAAQKRNLLPMFRRIFPDGLTHVLAYRGLLKGKDRDAASFVFESVENSQSGNNVDSCSFATENREVLSSDFARVLGRRQALGVPSVATFCLPIIMSSAETAYADSSGDLHMIYGEMGAGIVSGVQVLYLAALLGLVGVASFFVVRQVLIRRELESAAKILQDRVRTGEALPVEYFELGAVMLRKKFFGLAAKYLEQAIEKWDGDPQDLAQVHNALGFSYISDDKIERGIAQYEKAVKLQPGYVVAWNNLGNAYQKKKDLPKALKAYEQALFFDPNNKVAREYRDSLKERVDRLAGVPIKYD